MTPVPPIVILNGRKNAVREKRETGQWHRVKNLWFWWHLTAFLTTVTDPSRSLRMTINVPPIMTPFLPIVILNGRKNALWEKREAATWHRVKNLWLWWHLTTFLTTVTDPSLSLQDDVLWSSSSQQQVFDIASGWRLSSVVILNGGKNAVQEKRETGQWHRVKNLLLWMASYGFPHHGNRSFTFVQDDA